MNKFLRLPYEIFQRDNPSDMVCVKLPRVGIDALLSMSHRLVWQIWLDSEGNKVVLSDDELQLMEKTIYRLIVPNSCEDDSPTDPLVIIQYLKEKNAMCNQCGCCGCGNTPPMTGDNPDTPYLPPVHENESPIDDSAARCDMATQMLDGIEEVTLKMANFLNTIGVVGAAIDTAVGTSGKLSGWKPFTVPSFMFYMIQSLLIYWQATKFFNEATEVIGKIRNDYICSAVSAVSGTDLRRKWDEDVSNTRQDWGILMSTYMWFWFHLGDPEALFDSIWLEQNTWPEYVGSTCACTGEIDPDPIPPPAPGGDAPILVEDEALSYYLLPADIHLATGVGVSNGSLMAWEDQPTGVFRLYSEPDANGYLKVAKINPSSSLLLGGMDADWSLLKDSLLGWGVQVVANGIESMTQLTDWLGGGEVLNHQEPPFAGTGTTFMMHYLTAAGTPLREATAEAIASAYPSDVYEEIGGESPTLGRKFLKFGWRKPDDSYLRIWLLMFDGDVDLP